MTRIAALTTSDVTGQRPGRLHPPGPHGTRPRTARPPAPHAGTGRQTLRRHRLTSRQRLAVPRAAPGRPITPARLAERLRALGIPVKAGRRAALIDLAAQLPAAVLADLLGLHPTTVVGMDGTRPGGDWTRYAAQLARSRNHQP